jgi:DNA-directed RNA polymerase specialized sigma24 family protein
MTVSDTSDWPASHLRAADIAFAALTCEPAPVTLDCDSLAGDTGVDLGLPSGVVALPVLREWLLAHPDNFAARDAVWRELILRARLRGKEWVIGAVGMAMPALVRHARHLAVDYRGDPADIDNEVLTGFLEALRDHLDLTQPAPYASLIMAAWRAGRQLRLVQDVAVPVDDIEHLAAGSRTPKPPYGHPDLLVERAGTLRLIDSDDVQPWIDIRLGRRACEPIAARLGITVDALRMRLARADDRLAKALADGLLSGMVSAEAGKQLSRLADKRANIRASRAATATFRLSAQRSPRHTA